MCPLLKLSEILNDLSKKRFRVDFSSNFELVPLIENRDAFY